MVNRWSCYTTGEKDIDYGNKFEKVLKYKNSVKKEIKDIIKNESDVRGIILSGIAGDGKFRLAYEVAEELGFDRIYIDATRLPCIYPGLGAISIKRAFKNAIIASKKQKSQQSLFFK